MNKGDSKQAANWNFETRKFNSVEEAIDFAISREVEAQDFYNKFMNFVEDPKIANILSDLLGEEVRHEIKLYKVKSGKDNFKDDLAGSLDIVDYAPDAEPDAKMTYKDLLIVAMKKEETSRILYLKLASVAADKDVQKFFIGLSNEEARHKLRFELEYDLLTF